MGGSEEALEGEVVSAAAADHGFFGQRLELLEGFFVGFVVGEAGGEEGAGEDDAFGAHRVAENIAVGEEDGLG